MKTIFYVIIPCVAFVLILSNALFGHLLFESPYDQDINKYSIYIHLQSGWKSNSGNILYEITDVWSNPDSDPISKTINYDPSIPDSVVADRNYNELQYQNQKAFVELKHEFNNCETSWKPETYRYAIDTVRTNIEHLQGNQLNTDPYVQIFPNIPNKKYGLEEQKELVKQSFAQFIPICTSKNSTSYDYSVSTNDENIGFDVYFVPSKEQLDNYSTPSFEYYEEMDCFAMNKHSFSGTCDSVGSDSGLLILLPDDLTLAVTKVKVNLHEKT